jgi:hypothetical protein
MDGLIWIMDSREKPRQAAALGIADSGEMPAACHPHGIASHPSCRENEFFQTRRSSYAATRSTSRRPPKLETPMSHLSLIWISTTANSELPKIDNSQEARSQG